MEVEGEPKSSATVLEALAQSRKVFQHYNNFCRKIDDILSAKQQIIGLATERGWNDQEYDLFWASMEILKPAIYAKPPNIIVSTRFNDGNATAKVLAEMMERTLNSEFERGDIDQTMLDIRDDLSATNRGVAWMSYESKGGKRVCNEQLDRYDFLHEPARKWSEVGWVARCAYMTKQQMAERFRKSSGQAYEDASFNVDRQDVDNGASDLSMKAEVWEVWSRADNKVYWVSENVKVFLDEDEPHLQLSKGFPCPRPAYGTKQRRSLVPVPDYVRYEGVLDQINECTIKIYDLLEQVRMFGLIPGGGDIGNAIQAALNSAQSSNFTLIPVSGAQFGGAAAGGMATWWPIEQIASTIQGLISARQQLFSDFDNLSGISDIFRGETDAQETLGAQQLKGQYGSVRVKDKNMELVRVARDMAVIAAEIICDNYDQKTLLEVSQMVIPTKKEIQTQISRIESEAKKELAALMDQAEEAVQQAQMQSAKSGEPIPPEMQQQAQAQLQQAQQAIVAKYGPQLKQLQDAVTIDDVMAMMKDKKTRGLIIDVETDSTILIDEQAEKSSRAEFLNAFAGASQAIAPLIQAGEEGAKLAGAILKFSLQPYNANREIDSLIDDFVEKGAASAGQAANDTSQLELQKATEQANATIAQAELQKAQAATARVQADAALKNIDLQRKVQEMQIQAQKDAFNAQMEQERFRKEIAETQAKIQLMEAQTAEILASIGLDVRKQNLDEYTAAQDVKQKQTDTMLNAVGQARSHQIAERSAEAKTQQANPALEPGE